MRRRITPLQVIALAGMVLGAGGSENPETMAVNPLAIGILVVSIIVLFISAILENKKQLRHRPKRRNCF